MKIRVDKDVLFISVSSTLSESLPQSLFPINVSEIDSIDARGPLVEHLTQLDLLFNNKKVIIIKKKRCLEM